MRVGIFNLQSTRANYGAVLQAAALEQFVREHVTPNVEHIDFSIPQSAKPKPRMVQFFRWKLHGLKRRLRKMAGRPVPVSLKSVANVEVFEQFRKQNLNRTEPVSDRAGLERVSQGYDAVIVGSDQVWRLAFTGPGLYAFFLSFVPEGCRRIAYAASFGTDQWEGTRQQTVEARRYLEQFCAVSVRERSGLAICSDVLGVKATHVLDPVLLAGREYFEGLLESEPVKTAHTDIVYYKLRDGIVQYADIEAIAAGLGQSIDNIYYKPLRTESSSRIEHSFYPVLEWVDKIRGCGRMLVTDSFHGICFAILFEKDFLWIPNEDGGLSRLESLFEQLGLSDRRCRSVEDAQRMMADGCRIDFGKVNARLDVLRKLSAEFLINSLMGQGR